MRAVFLALGLWCVAFDAEADSVVFVSSDARAPEWVSAITSELVIYGVAPRFRRSPDARSPLERSAVAQRLARNLGATAAIWIESALPDGPRVRAVSPEGEYVAEALLPSPLAELDPRVLASVAANVLLDALGRTAPSELGCVQPPVMLSLACACMPPTPGMPDWSEAERRQ